MRRLLCAAVLAVSVLPAAAETLALPTLADVAGVAAGDVLNVRERPSATAPIIGKFAPGAKGIEVVAMRGGWMQVNVAERSGWSNGRYLQPRADVWKSGSLPAALRCFGTEPFWTLTPGKDSARFSKPEGEQDLTGIKVMDRGLPGQDQRRVLSGDGLNAVIAPAQCSDGMSDRNYGLEATLVVGKGDGRKLYTGCCTIEATGN